MNNHELLEILLEEFSKHTSLDLVFQTGIATEFGKICRFDRICGHDRVVCVLRIMIIEDYLIIHTKLSEFSYFSNIVKIPLCDPEMFNRVIAVIKQLENSEQLKTNK